MFLFGDETIIKSLKNERFLFESVKQRLDPFENPNLVIASTANNADMDMDDDQFKDFIKKQYENLSADYRQLMTFEYFLNQAFQDKEKFMRQAREQVHLQSTSDLDQGHFSRYKQALMLSLFKTVEQPNLWKYHADRYRGIAVKLKSADPYFTAQEYAGRPQFLTDVRYRNSRPDLADKSHPFPYLVNQPESLLKESEVRLLRPIQAADKVEEGFHFFKLPATLVKGIYFGPLMQPDTIQQHRDYFKIDQRYRNVPCYQMVTHQSMFQLDFVEL